MEVSKDVAETVFLFSPLGLVVLCSASFHTFSGSGRKASAISTYISTIESPEELLLTEALADLIGSAWVMTVVRQMKAFSMASLGFALPPFV